MSIVARLPSDPPFESTSTFARQVALVRGHLAPIVSHAALEASFAREAFHTGRASDGDAAASAAPVRAAYVIRWLELREGRSDTR